MKSYTNFMEAESVVKFRGASKSIGVTTHASYVYGNLFSKDFGTGRPTLGLALLCEYPYNSINAEATHEYVISGGTGLGEGRGNGMGYPIFSSRPSPKWSKKTVI